MIKIRIRNDDHIQGNKKAPITLLEYGDYQCLACGQIFPIVKLVQRDFGEKLKFVFRPFPLSEIHPYAEVAAETAEFAAQYHHFWKMHDLIFANQEKLGLPLLHELVKELKLPEDEFAKVLQKHSYLKKIKREFLNGVNSGVNGTPTFFINGFKHEGMHDYESLVAAIETQLISAK